MAERNEIVKDFHTGQMVQRFTARVIAKPCGNCGMLTQHYDAKYGWHICGDCDPDESASRYAHDVMYGCNGIF